MASLLKMKKTTDPRGELRDALKPFCQFNTCQVCIYLLKKKIYLYIYYNMLNRLIIEFKIDIF